MPDVQPFRALRYDFDRFADLSDVIAPPYDVLGPSDKDALLARSDTNIVAIDLPHLPPKSAGPPEVYEQSAERLRAWCEQGVLVVESAPALYRYAQVFEHQGSSYTRRMLIARVRLSPFSEGKILPHEMTFGGPKEDRLALMKATACNLSPVFALFSDPQGVVDGAFEETERRAPDAVGTMEDVENRIWIVRDASVVSSVADALESKAVFIADGHHRYSTALLYRDWLAEQHGGSLPPDHPAQFVMFVLASMDDPGCLILPYNRVLAGVHLDALLSAWSDAVAPCEESEADVRLFEGTTGKTVCLRFTRRERLDALEPDKSRAWRSLDVAYLHRVLIDECLHGAGGGTRAVQVRYVKSASIAEETARGESGVALLMNATQMGQLRAVSEAGDLMPQKSTYFYPKLVTGLAINPLS